MRKIKKVDLLHTSTDIYIDVINGGYSDSYITCKAHLHAIALKKGVYTNKWEIAKVTGHSFNGTFKFDYTSKRDFYYAKDLALVSKPYVSKDITIKPK